MIHSITQFFHTLALIIGSPQLLFIVFIISFSLKCGFLTYLAHRTLQSESSPRPIYFLMLVLLSSLVSDISWLLTPFVNCIDFRIYNMLVRIGWACTITFYQTLALFLESLTSPKNILSLRQKTFFIVSSILFLFYSGIAIIDLNCVSYDQKHWIETETIFTLTYIYINFSRHSSFDMRLPNFRSTR